MADDEPPANSPPANSAPDHDPPDSDDEDHGDNADYGDNDANETESEPRFHCGKWKNFLWARDAWIEHEAEQRDLRNRLPDLTRRHIELLEAKNDGATVAWRKNEGKEFTQEARNAKRKKGSKLQGLMEDALYYQNATHRKKRSREMEKFKVAGEWRKKKGLIELPKKVLDREEKVASGKANGKTKGKAKKKEYSLSGEIALTDVKAMLNGFDRAGTGGPSHRSRFVDANGQPIEGGTTRPVLPHELRLWTPTRRRAPVGLRNKPWKEEECCDLVLDLEAIAERQRRVDSKPNTTEGVRHRNHLERRNEELQMYDSNGEPGSIAERPSTSRLYHQARSNGEATLHSFRHIRTNEGLFVSALESSRDWRTSYDYLGWNKSGQHAQFQNSAVRGTPMIDNPPTADEEEDEDKRVVIVFEDTKGIEKESADEEELALDKGGMSSLGVPLEKRKRVEGIEYPYEALEFTRDCKRPRMCLDPEGKQSFFETTEWDEETTGRREWHVHMALSPSSSVDSPPRSPIDPGSIDMNSIPAYYPNTDIAALEPYPRRKCTRDPERCRAWWTHAPDECWIVKSVPARARPDETQIQTPEDFRLPTGGRRIYDARLPDHYGIDGAGEALWPKIGVRVPYLPLTFDDHKLAPFRDNEAATREPSPPDDGTDQDTSYFTAIDSKRRRAYEVHALAVPIIKQPVRAWGVVDVEPPAAPGGPGDEESDDENDLFKIAYSEGSRTAPAPLPAVDDVE